MSISLVFVNTSVTIHNHNLTVIVDTTIMISPMIISLATHASQHSMWVVFETVEKPLSLYGTLRRDNNINTLSLGTVSPAVI